MVDLERNPHDVEQKLTVWLRGHTGTAVHVPTEILLGFSPVPR